MLKIGLYCCTRGKDRDPSLDFDHRERIMTYDGLESILGNHPFENDSGTSKEDGCPTDSLDDLSSCCSNKDLSGSISSMWTAVNRKDDDDEKHYEWGVLESDLPPYNYLEGSPCSNDALLSDMELMKERFSKLLLGEDIAGGRKGISTALALSNAITNLGVLSFGEMWKLEPLSKENKQRWKKELNWFLSPTNYMVELVPAVQNSSDGCTMEIMTPKVREDIHMNLPALQKLDSILHEILDSMVNTEFWYDEGGNCSEGRKGIHAQKWWPPLARVPVNGLSDLQRKKLMNQSKIVLQVFKAVKSINDCVLLTMPVPEFIRDALPKTGKECLGEDLYILVISESKSLDSLNVKSEQQALEVISKLETAAYIWRERVTKQVTGSPPVRTSWSFFKDPVSEIDKMELHLENAELHIQALKSRFPNLPQTFLNVTKIKYGKDVGLAIIEAYSRVLAKLAFNILSRIGEILQEDAPGNLSSPSTAYYFPGSSPLWLLSTLPTIGDKFLPCNPSHHRQEFYTEEDRCSSNPAKKNSSKLWLSRRKSSRQNVQV